MHRVKKWREGFLYLDGKKRNANGSDQFKECQKLSLLFFFFFRFFLLFQYYLCKGTNGNIATFLVSTPVFRCCCVAAIIMAWHITYSFFKREKNIENLFPFYFFIWRIRIVCFIFFVCTQPPPSPTNNIYISQIIKRVKVK